MFKLTDYIPEAELETFCQKNHITKMSLFGSALRDELKPGSDIDILVEFDKNHIPGLLDLAGMESACSIFLMKPMKPVNMWKAFHLMNLLKTAKPSGLLYDQ